jgi:hypothetical protein
MTLTIVSIHSHLELNMLDKIFIYLLWFLSTYQTVKTRLGFTKFYFHVNNVSDSMVWTVLTILGSSNFFGYIEVWAPICSNIGEHVSVYFISIFWISFCTLSNLNLFFTVECISVFTGRLRQYWNVFFLVLQDWNWRFKWQICDPCAWI